MTKKNYETLTIEQGWEFNPYSQLDQRKYMFLRLLLFDDFALVSWCVSLSFLGRYR